MSLLGFGPIASSPIAAGAETVENLSLAADAGSYAITGAAAGLVYSREIAATAGNYVLTGSAASLELARAVTAEAGSYALAGTDAQFAFGARLAAEAGSYSITGQPATLTLDYVASAEAGSYAVTGAAASVVRLLPLVAEAGSYSVSGTATGALIDRLVTAEAGSYTVTGSAATLILGNVLTLEADAGSYAVTGADATLQYGYVIAVEPGSYTVTGSAAAFVYDTPQIRLNRNILKAYSTDPVVVLLEISHADLSETIRVTNNGEALTSNGNTFQQFPFDIELPGDTEDEPVAKLRIANVDRTIGDAVDAITTPATVSIALVLASDPDTLMLNWLHFELRNVTLNALEVTADLMIRTYATEPFPNIRVRESNFPNLYK